MKLKKNVLICAISFSAIIGCGTKRDPLPFQAENTIVGLASPLKLGFDSTELVLSDYFPLATPDSFRLPSGLIAHESGKGIIIKGDQKAGIGNFRVFIDASPYDIPVLKSKKKQYLFQFADRNHQYKSVTISGSMNGWVSTRDSLGYSNGVWIKPIILDPGQYEYHLFIDGEEMLDPTNPDSIDNGLGGYNSVFTVAGNEGELSIQTDSILQGGFSISGPTEGVQYKVYWNNLLLPDSYIQSTPKGIEVEIPELATTMERSDIRVWAVKGDLVSPDLFIPLHNGAVIKNPALLSRKDQRNMIMYFALVDRFYDGNQENNFPTPDPEIKPLANNLGGDISGIYQKLDEGYFGRLEVNTIWLSPIGRNPDGAWGLWDEGGVRSKFSGYHGYWPAQSKTIDPRFGTEQDLDDLTDLAHRKSYSILIDYVANHVHKDHPVYKEHPDWATDLYLPDGRLNTEKWDEQRLTTWFDTFLPTLDLENEEVAEAMSDSAVYWFERFDIDGFRHDATKHVPTSFWRMLTHKLKTRVMIPGERSIYQIGETYGNPELIGSYISSGLLDAQFDFNLYDASIASIGREEISFKRLGDELENSLNAYGYHHLMGNMSGNQDRARFISYADGSVDWGEDAKLAGWTRDINNNGKIGFQRLAMLHAFNMTAPGIPVIYYGDEIGLPGANDPDNRRMMIFDDLNEDQEKLKSIVTNLCTTRKTWMALQYGQTNIHQADGDLFIMSRSYFSESVFLLMNKSSEKTEAAIPQKDYSKLRSFSGEKYKKGEPIVLGPYSFEILILEK